MRWSSWRRSTSSKLALIPESGLVLLALDLLVELPLAAPESLGDLVQGAAPLRRVLLDLALGGRECCLGGFAPARAHTGQCRPLLLMARIEAPVVRFDPVLGFGHQLALALSQLLDLHPDAVLELLQVAGEQRRARPRAGGHG